MPLFLLIDYDETHAGEIGIVLHIVSDRFRSSTPARRANRLVLVRDSLGDGDEQLGHVEGNIIDDLGEIKSVALWMTSDGHRNLLVPGLFIKGPVSASLHRIFWVEPSRCAAQFCGRGGVTGGHERTVGASGLVGKSGGYVLLKIDP